jgi:hypothetical protein
MIVSAKTLSPKLTPEHQEQFVTMLPIVTRIARHRFSDLNAEAKNEATAEVVATAFILFVSLVKRGREALAYPSVLALFGVRRVRTGRQAATHQNIQDISSSFCQIQKGISLERLDRPDREGGCAMGGPEIERFLPHLTGMPQACS